MKKSLLVIALTTLFLSQVQANETSTTDHSKMDHSQMSHDVKMDHSKMDHGAMTTYTKQDNQEMDHSKMDHSMMDHGAMVSKVGMPAPQNQASQTVKVSLSDDMKIQFAQPLNIKQGDIVHFSVTNTGKIAHEFSIGSIEEQAKHREMMKSMPDMKHDDGTTITVEPGQTKDITWHFMGEKFIEFACNIPAHSEHGMKINYVLQ
ncbi:copper-binding protein [Photobacterium damselae]|uniref:copper-binding protein n=1 Tax=Photobacterium damselae TaxID=38293 RepID=UPI00254379AD|nr:copper-binding protein [Photobacterium damselae]WIH18671.1 copper-binding protein [Photobacterium damselae]